MLSTQKRYRVERKAVCRLKFIFEAYDGIALISTIDPYAAEVRLFIPPGCETEVDELMHDLKQDMRLEEIISDR